MVNESLLTPYYYANISRNNGTTLLCIYIYKLQLSRNLRLRTKYLEHFFTSICIYQIATHARVFFTHWKIVQQSEFHSRKYPNPYPTIVFDLNCKNYRIIYDEKKKNTIVRKKERKKRYDKCLHSRRKVNKNTMNDDCKKWLQ